VLPVVPVRVSLIPQTPGVVSSAAKEVTTVFADVTLTPIARHTSALLNHDCIFIDELLSFVDRYDEQATLIKSSEPRPRAE
jgi:hypothetical protein